MEGGCDAPIVDPEVGFRSSRQSIYQTILQERGRRPPQGDRLLPAPATGLAVLHISILVTLGKMGMNFMVFNREAQPSATIAW